MNIDDVYPRRFATGADLGAKEPTLAIRLVSLEEMGPEHKKKPVLWFAGCKKGVVLTKPLARCVADLYGPETDAWVGRRVTLYTEEVEAFGETFLAFRAKAPADGGEI